MNYFNVYTQQKKSISVRMLQVDTSHSPLIVDDNFIFCIFYISNSFLQNDRNILHL